MRILGQIWSMVLAAGLLLLLYLVIVNLPRFKRVIPDPGFRDFINIEKEETSGVDGTVTVQKLQHGDVIAYRTSVKSDKNIGFGYVVALPGETFIYQPLAKEQSDYLGQFLVDNQPHEGGRIPPFPVVSAPIPVPLNHVYVLSDQNRMDSVALGPIPGGLIIGRVKGL